MGITRIRGNQIKDESVDSKDIASGSIKAGEMSSEAIIGQATITTTDYTNDRLLMWDATDSSLKQIPPGALLTPQSPFIIDATEPSIQFKEGGSDRAEININDSDNLLLVNQSTNKFIVFKTNDAGTVREGLRLGGTVPEVVINEGSDSLIDFRVESNNKTHMLFIDGSADRVTIGTNAASNADANFLVSGSMGSKGSSNKGTSVFGGDVVVSGSLYAKQRHINTAKFSSTDTSQRYVRWDAAGSNGTPGVNNKFLVPAPGRLIKVLVRSTLAAGNTNVAFHRAVDGDSDLNTTAIETKSINMASSNTAYAATFSSTSNFSP